MRDTALLAFGCAKPPTRGADVLLRKAITWIPDRKDSRGAVD